MIGQTKSLIKIIKTDMNAKFYAIKTSQVSSHSEYEKWAFINCHIKFAQMQHFYTRMIVK